jgi:T5SS/PEP-CTERM-associated repeat protein
VTVSGAGSVWNNSDQLAVGFYGAGTLIIQGGATVSVGDGLILGNWSGSTGTVNLIDGTLDLEGTDLGQGTGEAIFNFLGGTLRGAGKIELDQTFSQNGGTLAPGGSIGQTDIVGDYELNAGTLEIELGGVGDPIDLVSVTGDIDIATLGTALDLRALGPMAAGTYTLLESTGGTITGLFENVSTFNLFGVNISVLNTGTAITVTLDGDLIFADPNLDGFVGIADLNIVLGNWNQNVTPGDILAGDLNGDGFVGIEDLNAVLGNWNAGEPPLDNSANIPEPACAVLLLMGIAGLSQKRFRGAA